MAVSQSQLKAFHAVAATKSFTRAAEMLFLSQPAVSDQVRKLEEHYAVQLFVRARRSISLTAIGEELYVLTTNLFSIEAEAEALLVGSKTAALEDTLRLAVDSPRHLSSYIGLFRKKFPHIGVVLLSGNSEESLRRLLDYQVDAAVMGRPHEGNLTESTILSISPILVMCGKGHPFLQREDSARQAIDIGELQGQALVMRERGSATRRLVEQTLHSYGITPGPVIEASGREAVGDLVASDLGLGFVSVAETHNDSRIMLLSIRDAQIAMQETLVWLRNGQSEHTKAFVELVQQERAKIFPDGWIF